MKTKQAETKKRPSLDERKAELSKQAASMEKEAAVLLTKESTTSEQRFASEYRKMLKYNSLLITRLNEQLKGSLSSRDIYALSTLMSQQREVINDLRSVADLSQQVNMLYERSTNPFIGDVTQLVTDVYYQLRRLITETAKPKETQFALAQLDDLVKQLGMGIQTAHGVLRQSISDTLVGGQTPKPQKKAKVH